jgi:hypothetical protein
MDKDPWDIVDSSMRILLGQYGSGCAMESKSSVEPVPDTALHTAEHTSVHSYGNSMDEMDVRGYAGPGLYHSSSGVWATLTADSIAGGRADLGRGPWRFVLPMRSRLRGK